MTKSNERVGMPANDTDRKPYEKPTLTKGPVLSSVTAVDGGGGSIIVDEN